MERKLQIRSIVVLFMAVFVSTNLFAYDFEVDGIYYNKNADDTSVSVMYSDLNAIVIPCTVTHGGNAYIVTQIGQGAFNNCANLESVTIPNSVVTISYGAFSNCKNLKNIIIPNSVIEILDGAFDGCKSLQRITIPNSVISIGEWVFNCCSEITTITIGKGIAFIGNGAFAECTGVDTIICKGKYPVSLYFLGKVNFAFSAVNPKVCIVPCGSKEAYQNADIWQGFNIEEDYCITVITGEATDITNNSATFHGKIETTGKLSAKGFQYKKTTDEIYATIDIDIETETFDYTLVELDEGSEYTFRAFAAINNDTTFGEEKTFVTLDDSGIKEVADKNTISIYPNPANGIVFIENVAEGMEHISIKVYDMQGKMIFEDTNINTKRYALSTRSFEKGVYYVRIGNMTEKLVVE